MIAVAGEALIDLVFADGVLVPHPGGGPYNTAIALGRLDVPVGFVGRISSDSLGRLLARRLAESGVDDRYLLRGDAPTPLAVVDDTGDGSHSFTFYLVGTAYADLTPSELPELGPDVVAVHAGTLALATDPPAGAIEALLTREAERRVIVVDPNVRPAVFGEPDEYRTRFERWARFAHVIKLSDADSEWLYPGEDPEAVLDKLLGLGVQLAVLTRGPAGAVAKSTAGRAEVAAPQVEVVDTVGAGDAFGAGLLRRLWETERLTAAAVGRLDDAKLEDALTFATAVAALGVGRMGADPPALADVRTYLSR
jgi:fructokinase